MQKRWYQVTFIFEKKVGVLQKGYGTLGEIEK